MVSTKVFLAFLSTALSIGMVSANTGDATYFEVGQGACGAQSKDSDIVAALSADQFGNGERCFEHITINYQGKSVDATIVDKCPGCAEYDLDLSPAAFSALADESMGRISVNWSYDKSKRSHRRTRSLRYRKPNLSN